MSSTVTAKRCRKCGEVKPVSEFHKDTRKKGRLRSHCKSCDLADARKWRQANRDKCVASSRKWRAANIERDRAARRKRYAADPGRGRAENRRWREANPAAVMLNSVRGSAKAEGIPFALTLADIQLPEHCPTCTKELAPLGAPRMNRPSVDKYDPVKGYVPGNVWVICMECNQRKQDLSGEQMAALAARIGSEFFYHHRTFRAVLSAYRTPETTLGVVACQRCERTGLTGTRAEQGVA